MIMKATKQAQIYVFVVVRLPQIFTIISKLLFAIVNEKKKKKRQANIVEYVCKTSLLIILTQYREGLISIKDNRRTRIY